MTLMRVNFRSAFTPSAAEGNPPVPCSAARAVYSGGHSGQVSTIASSTSRNRGNRLIGRDAGWRILAATARARSRACGSPNATPAYDDTAFSTRRCHRPF